MQAGAVDGILDLLRTQVRTRCCLNQAGSARNIELQRVTALKKLRVRASIYVPPLRLQYIRGSVVGLVFFLPSAEGIGNEKNRTFRTAYTYVLLVYTPPPPRMYRTSFSPTRIKYLGHL